MLNEKISSQTTYEIKMSDILFDENTNCRKLIDPFIIRQLAADIKRDKLKTPVSLITNVTGTPHKYKLVAGFRRYKACELLGHQTIMAFHFENMSETDARIWNLNENIQRMDLNKLEEANAIQKIIESGLTVESIATKLQQTKGWVQVRSAILRLRPEIQEEVAIGTFTDKQIKTLAGMDDSEKQNAFVRTIKDSRLKHEKLKLHDYMVPLHKAKTQKKQRTQGEIKEMLGHIYDKLGPSIATRVLAWATGEVSNGELFDDLKKFADENDLNYIIPGVENVADT